MPTSTKAAKKPMVREFTFEHDTKGAIRFKQDPETGNLKRAAIGTFYLTKEAVAAELPAGFKRIRVTVEVI